METGQILDSEFDVISPWMLLYEIISKYVYNKSVLKYKGSLKEQSFTQLISHFDFSKSRLGHHSLSTTFTHLLSISCALQDSW